MKNSEMIRELRALTQAGMKDCKDALEESGWDLQKAVDIVKVKGLNVVDGRAGKVAADGALAVYFGEDFASMVEINCQTDFVAKNPEFLMFANKAAQYVGNSVIENEKFDAATPALESARTSLISTIKENIVVRRWWSEIQMSPLARVFAYVHSNNKIGVLLTLVAPSLEARNSEDFVNMGNDLAMQVAAMNPVGVSSDRVPADVLERQKSIFDTQLKEMNKPPAAQVKILEGKFRKWYTEVCLLEQESVVVPKSTVNQLLKNLSAKLGGEVTVANFVRAQVGDGIEVQKENYTDEVARLSGVPQSNTFQGEPGSQDVIKY